MSGDITTESANIKRIIREYYERLYGNAFNNLYEMNKFFERHIQDFTAGRNFYSYVGTWGLQGRNVFNLYSLKDLSSGTLAVKVSSPNHWTQGIPRGRNFITSPLSREQLSKPDYSVDPKKYNSRTLRL